MENIFFEGLHQLQKNTWGIEEPKHGVPTPTEKIDMVIVPLLCFDKLGNRVGYGKGYYDRFLSVCKPGVQKIGLSLFNEPAIIDDVNNTDIPMTSCITPNSVVIF